MSSPEIYSDSNGNRVIYRNAGIPGPGLPPGGTVGQIPVKQSSTDYDVAWGSTGAGEGDVVGPAVSVNNRLAAFNGTTGKLIKDSGLLIADVFTVTQAADKVDKVVGKGLSANDFTDALKAKLDAATAENFRGEYATFLALTTAIPLGNPGDYANVVTLGTDVVQYIWDDTNDVWTSLNAAASFDGQDIADLLYNPTDAAGYDQNTNRIYTAAEKAQVADSVPMAYLNGLLISAGIVAPAYAAFSYFDLTGVVVPIIGVSDGVTNLVKIDPATVLDAASTLFDSPVAGRLRYIGTESRLVVATFAVSFNGPASAEMVFALAKNGSALTTSKIVATGSTNTTPVSNTVLVPLVTNDYVEVFVGNTTNTSDPTVKTLTLEASPA